MHNYYKPTIDTRRKSNRKVNQSSTRKKKQTNYITKKIIEWYRQDASKYSFTYTYTDTQCYRVVLHQSSETWFYQTRTEVCFVFYSRSWCGQNCVFFPFVPLKIRVRCTARVVVANAMENIFQVLESKRTKIFATRFGLILFVRWFSAGSWWTDWQKQSLNSHWKTSLCTVHSVRGGKLFQLSVFLEKSEKRTVERGEVDHFLMNQN